MPATKSLLAWNSSMHRAQTEPVGVEALVTPVEDPPTGMRVLGVGDIRSGLEPGTP